MWIPRWLGEYYSRLFAHFEGELFTFQQARQLLSVSETKLSVAFSKLHSKRILLIFHTGKPRQYRLIDPENFILAASETIGNLQRIPQERYLNLICDCFRETSKGLGLESLAVYGSVARGSATTHSDVDMLFISDDFQGSLGSRMEKLYDIENALRDELSWLRRHDTYTGISSYPLKKEEAQRMPSLFLDLTEEAVILYDKERFLEKTLLELKAKLIEIGARKVLTGKGQWYWDLKPDYRFGETIATA